MKKKLKFSNGEMIMIHDDDFRANYVNPKLEISKIERASNVEPMEDKPGLWYVDLAPVNGPRIEGFKTRNEAIEYEINWINENHLKVNKNA
ncbi:hypothetical protein [Cetobacterium sp.]|uniref:hypothetical protein n=1 Tax=Cetobacterium sp. TaxID=2071632 RepID=UPI003F39251C